MQSETEVELLQERIDLRERLEMMTLHAQALKEENERLRSVIRGHSATIDRLRLHLQQGIEL